MLFPRTKGAVGPMEGVVASAPEGEGVEAEEGVTWHLMGVELMAEDLEDMAAEEEEEVSNWYYNLGGKTF